LPSPTILQGDDYFNIALYTGNGSTQSITGVGFQPDFVWLKSRSSGSRNHFLFDAVRGTSAALYSNLTTAETTSSGVTAFGSDGFSIGSNGNGNENTQTYVGWNWKASNAAAVSNVAGTITSSVSANTTAGFSIVTYTGNGSSGATIGHGLGVAPSMVIVQTRAGTNNRDKPVYHASLGNTKALTLNSTAAQDTWAGYWNNTSPSSTVVTLGNDQNTNTSGSTYVAYCFAAVPGYSAFGSWTGNGSTAGPFIYTGFRPRYILLKRSDTAGPDWYIFDTSINPYNAMQTRLTANTSVAQNSFGAGLPLDGLSNGFKFTTLDGDFNASGGTYIYMAFSENPFKNALAR
jgi:hypothetical protein